MRKTFKTIDYHVAGEPLRIIQSGLPLIKGRTQLDKRAYAMKHLETLRTRLMFEPRGHVGMYGCIMTPPSQADADFGVLFMHNEGWSTMCGHGIIAVMTMGLTTGQIKRKADDELYLIDSPAGRIKAKAHWQDDQLEEVSFINVPSFVFKENVAITIDDRTVTLDITFGGAFYGIIESQSLGLKVDNGDLPQIKAAASKIKAAIERKMKVIHPEESGLNGIYGIIFLDQPKQKQADLRNVTIFADEQVDRSPCGTGTSAVAAKLFNDQKLKIGDSFKHESITNGIFTGTVLSKTTLLQEAAVIPEVKGRAFITGEHQFYEAENDPLKDGFLL